jgi:hypothetical protein
MRQAAVEEARRKFQVKYDKEAKEAAEKKKQVSSIWFYVTVPRNLNGTQLIFKECNLD